MSERQERARRRAVERYLSGENPKSIYTSLGYSHRWFFKWIERYQEGDSEWFCERSRRPAGNARATTDEVEQFVVAVRLVLHDEGLFAGAQAIRWELEENEVHPLPSLRTISRILVRHSMASRRKGRYEPKGRKYPKLLARKPGDVHQTDFVGPCFLRGPVRFYSLNSVDLHTHCCAVEPMQTRGVAETINALWATWQRLGMPKNQQVDNEMVFFGSPAHPRGMGNLIRLCVLNGIEPWFIPMREPWRNGVVEKFNDHWRQKFLKRVEMKSASDLCSGSLEYEAQHNGRYRYSALGGKTPLAILASSATRLRFPPTVEAPTHPLPKPTEGKYHVVRFIRSTQILDVFTERFKLPPEATYEYVRATIDVGRQRLGIYLDEAQIEEFPYQLR